MLQSSYRENSGNIRRLLRYKEVSVAGHFQRRAVRLPGSINNYYYAIFNIRSRRPIVLWKKRKDTIIIEYRRKSPYHPIILNVLMQHAKHVLVRRIRVDDSRNKLTETAKWMDVKEPKYMRKANDAQIRQAVKRKKSLTIVG